MVLRYTDEGLYYHRKQRMLTKLKVCPFIQLSLFGTRIDNKQERFKILLLLQKIALDLSNLRCRLQCNTVAQSTPARAS